MLTEKPMRHKVNPARMKGDRIFSLSETWAKVYIAMAACTSDAKKGRAETKSNVLAKTYGGMVRS